MHGEVCAGKEALNCRNCGLSPVFQLRTAAAVSWYAIQASSGFLLNYNAMPFLYRAVDRECRLPNPCRHSNHFIHSASCYRQAPVNESIPSANVTRRPSLLLISHQTRTCIMAASCIVFFCFFNRGTKVDTSVIKNFGYTLLSGHFLCNI